MAIIDNPIGDKLDEWGRSIFGEPEINEDGSYQTDAQRERVFYAMVAKAICKNAWSIAQVNEYLGLYKRLSGAPWWLHLLDDSEFLQLQLYGECAPVGQMGPGPVAGSEGALANQGDVDAALATQRRSWLLVGGAAVVGAAMVGVGVWLLRPKAKKRRRRRR